MNQTIADVADIVGGELTRAKNRIEQGREEIHKYVAGLGPELKKFGAEAERNVASKFEDLDKDVDAKKDAVVSDLAQKYVEARNSVDESIKQMQEENKGLWDKAKAMVGDAIEAILKLKDLFMGLLAKAAGAFTKILAGPLEFISSFMGAVKQGFMNFASNILEHLKKGLMGWLFGALAEAGIEIPSEFSFMGILKLVLSILGLTWASIKARIARVAPWAAKAIDFIESKVEVFVVLATQGVAGLWKWIKDKLGDLKDMILTPIKDFVVTKIVTAGIQWVLGMLNPAGALIKIVQALMSVVQWIMERGASLMDLVSTVIDAVSDIAAAVDDKDRRALVVISDCTDALTARKRHIAPAGEVDEEGFVRFGIRVAVNCDIDSLACVKGSECHCLIDDSHVVAWRVRGAVGRLHNQG